MNEWLIIELKPLFPDPVEPSAVTGVGRDVSYNWFPAMLSQSGAAVFPDIGQTDGRTDGQADPS